MARTRAMPAVWVCRWGGADDGCSAGDGAVPAVFEGGMAGYLLDIGGFIDDEGDVFGGDGVGGALVVETVMVLVLR